MTFLATVSPPSDCCFRYGLGAFSKPCCLETITCEEHDQLVEDNKVNPIAGGSFGKHKVCPKDAEEAHRLVSGLLFHSLRQNFLSGLKHCMFSAQYSCNCYMLCYILF